MTSGFAQGFGSAIMMLALLALGANVAGWLVSHEQPEAFISFLTTPLFSIADILQLGFLLVLLYVVVWMVVKGPRM